MAFPIMHVRDAGSPSSPTLKGRQAIRPELLNRGIALGYIGIMVGLPILAISTQAVGEGVGRLWQDLIQPEALYSLRLTFLMALIMVVLNSVVGTATAWVLVRYRFPGQTDHQCLD